MLTDRDHVTAIAVVDLARELKRHAVINLTQIQNIDPKLAEYVVALEEDQDISELMERRYPESWIIALWQLADSNPLATSVGARIGATVSPEARGLLINLIQHCENLKEVLETYLNNISLANASESWKIGHRDNRIELTFSFTAGKLYPRCATERSMVALHKWAEYLCGQKIPVCSVEFTFPQPEYKDFLQRLFRCEIHFDCSRNTLILHEDVLFLPLPQRNRYVKGILEQKISSLCFPEENGSIEERARRLLRENLASYHSIENLAQALCMSRATLYRKLKEKKTSFSRLLDEERQRLLYLHRHLPAAQLCDLLGFRDTSAYYKARKRWN